MKLRSRRASISAAALVTLWCQPALAQTAAAPSPLAEAPITYVVRAGDTLFDLAREYLNRPSDYRQLQRQNNVANPRRMATGRDLAIPVSLLRTRADPARLESYRGQVQLQRTGQNLPLSAGMSLMEGDILSTGANTFIRVVMSDGSFAVVPSNSRVMLERLRRYDINDQPDYRLKLLQGRIENSVTPRQRPGAYRVITPAAVSAVRGTQFRVAYMDDTGLSATGVLEGTVLNVADTGQAAMDITAGEGAFASLNVEGLREVTLLNAPAMTDPGAPQTGPVVAFNVPLPNTARAVRARIGSDAGMTDPVSEADSANGHLLFDTLADGRWFVRVSAVSNEGMEGRARTYDFIRARNGVEALNLLQARENGMRLYRFGWRGVGEGQAHFRFQLWRVDAQGEQTGGLMVDQPDISDSNFTLTNLPPGDYAWRVEGVRHRFGVRLAVWSDPELLTIS